MLPLHITMFEVREFRDYMYLVYIRESTSNKYLQRFLRWFLLCLWRVLLRMRRHMLNLYRWIIRFMHNVQYWANSFECSMCFAMSLRILFGYYLLKMSKLVSRMQICFRSSRMPDMLISKCSSREELFNQMWS